MVCTVCRQCTERVHIVCIEHTLYELCTLCTLLVVCYPSMHTVCLVHTSVHTVCVRCLQEELRVCTK